MNLSPDLNRVSPRGGTNYRYQYVYANSTECGPRQPFQFEFWVPKGRKGGSWVPQHAAPVGNYRTWRKVRPHHNHADKLAHSIAAVKSGGYALDVETQIKTYLDWAQRAGLTCVTVFKGCKISKTWAPLRFATTEVDPAEFIGPAPAPDCYGDWDHDGTTP